MSRSKQKRPLDMPIMKVKCKTCPFKDGNEDLADIKASVIATVLASGSQVCHTSGWPVGTHLCRGARDFQLMVFYRMGFLDAPTDEAWEQRCQELGLRAPGNSGEAQG